MRSKGVGICATCQFAQNISGGSVACRSENMAEVEGLRCMFKILGVFTRQTIESLSDWHMCHCWCCKNSGVTLDEARGLV